MVDVQFSTRPWTSDEENRLRDVLDAGKVGQQASCAPEDGALWHLVSTTSTLTTSCSSSD